MSTMNRDSTHENLDRSWMAFGPMWSSLMEIQTYLVFLRAQKEN